MTDRLEALKGYLAVFQGYWSSMQTMSLKETYPNFDVKEMFEQTVAIQRGAFLIAVDTGKELLEKGLENVSVTPQIQEAYNNAYNAVAPPVKKAYNNMTSFAALNLTAVVWQILGFMTALFPLTLVALKILRKGYEKVFAKNERSIPLQILNDPQWFGNEGFIQVTPEVKIHYVEKGDRSKPLMLFLHGFPEFWFSWRYQLEHFSKDYHCVAIDMRGYNFSDKPEGIREYGMDRLCSDVKAVIEGMDKKQCILVGHDWGGSVGYGFCATYPEMVSCFIVCNLPHPQSIRHEQANSWKQRLMSWYMLFFQCPTIPEFFFTHDDYALLDEIVKEQKASNHEEIAEAYKYAFKDQKSVTATINYYRCALQYPESYEPMVAEKINTPVLSIFGTDDNAMSIEAARGTRRYVENLTEDYVDGVGHWVQIEDPQRVNKSMEDFLLFHGQTNGRHVSITKVNSGDGKKEIENGHGPKKNGSKFSLKRLAKRRSSQDDLDTAGLLENGSAKPEKKHDFAILENGSRISEIENESKV